MRKRIGQISKWSLLSLILFASTASAGWVSGGGELISDSRNPWWVKNTKEVHYCVQIDENNFGVSKPRASELINKALSYWTRQFKDITYGAFADGDGGIAQQKFIESACGQPNVLLNFQLGILTTQQIQKIPGVTGFVGLSVRTNYVPATLKGEGFIYIAPQSGPLRPQAPNLLPDFWQRDQQSRLYLTLLHETGHLFGLPHTSKIVVMNEDLPYWAASSTAPDWPTMSLIFDQLTIFKFTYQQTFPLGFCFSSSQQPQELEEPEEPEEPIRTSPPRTFHIQKNFLANLSPAKPVAVKSPAMSPMRFFGLDANEGCIEPTLVGKELVFILSTSNGASIEFGRSNLELNPSPHASEKIIDLYLTSAAQSIFPNADFSRPVQAMGFYEAEVLAKGLYKNADGRTQRRLSLIWSGGMFTHIGGVADGEPYFDILDGF